MRSNYIHTIKDETFESLDHLAILDLSYNMISTIHKNAFIGLEKVYSLALAGNYIYFIS